MIKKTCLKTYTALVALAVLAGLSGCQNKGVRVKDVNGALYVCRSELKILQSKSSASVDELIESINLTEQMEDSIISFSVRDTAYAANTKMQDEVLSVSDSLRQEILRLALSKPRSLADVARRFSRHAFIKRISARLRDGGILARYRIVCRIYRREPRFCGQREKQSGDGGLRVRRQLQTRQKFRFHKLRGV